MRRQPDKMDDEEKDFLYLQMTQKLQTTTDNDLKLEQFTFFLSGEKKRNERKINKNAIIFNRNLCIFPRFIIAGDFYVVNKFPFSFVRTLFLVQLTRLWALRKGCSNIEARLNPQSLDRYQYRR